MIRNLKVLGLALAAVFAFSAISASGAMAQNGTLTVFKLENEKKVVEDKPVTLTGEETGGGEVNKLTAFGQKTTCENSTYTGHKTKTFEQTTHTEETELPKHEFLPSGASEVTITPHYSNCVTAGSFPTTVHMNGCDYELALGATSEHAEDTYSVTSRIRCPAGQHIVITVFGSIAKHEAKEPFCVTTVEENEEAGYAGLVVRDTTNGHLDITGTATGIKVTRTSPTGSILCTNKTEENATLVQDITVEGHNEAGEPTTIGLHHAGA